MRQSPEKGAAAILVAASLLFLLGMAAIAVDVSGFYQDARVAQTTADLACLAGVADLPDKPDDARTNAAAYAKANWPEMTGFPMSGADDTRTITNAGNVITIETKVDGDPMKMRVTIVDRSPTFFGRVLGAQSVDIRQEATCVHAEAHAGPPLVPFAALPGLFGGDLFNCAENKVTGNCGAIDSGSGANAFRDAIANGIEGDFEKHHGNWSSPDPDTGRAGTECSPPTFPSPCNADKTEPGNMTGPLEKGMETRLEDVSDADCVKPGPFNCDSLSQVIGSMPGTLGSTFGAAPSWWEPSVYGSYESAKTVQYYWNGDINKCDSPRMATVPIVVENDNWDIGDAAGTWPHGKSERMKFIGFYTVYIREPTDPGDLKKLSSVDVDVVWFGPDATCDGVPFDPFGGETIPGGVKLVAG